MNIHDEEHSGRPSLITDILIEDNKNRENRCFIISQFPFMCPNVSHFVIYEILIGKLANINLRTRWMLKMLKSRNILLQCMDCCNVIQNKDNELYDHIVMGDETWMSFLDDKLKKQSTQWQNPSSGG